MSAKPCQDTLRLLKRKTRSLVQFTDVVPETEPEHDFDSELTIGARSLQGAPFSGQALFGIGAQPLRSEYGAELVTHLQEASQIVIDRAIEYGADPEHPDIVSASERLENTALRCVVNIAPRDEETNSDQNGRDFYLAITANGVEVYCCPYQRLRILETRREIIRLYRIPTAGHPLFNGKREQFRSSIISSTRLVPEHMEVVYEYADRADLLEAVRNGTHSSPIPVQENLAQVGFVDKFGNVRLSVRNKKEFWAEVEKNRQGDQIFLRLENGKTMRAFLVKSLVEVPGNKLGLYENVADTEMMSESEEEEEDFGGYVEFLRRLEDPNDPQSFSAEKTLRAYLKRPIGSVLGEKVTIIPPVNPIEIEEDENEIGMG